MSLLAETIVEEWLNRQGYFTIRGIKLGHHEIDFLAVKPQGNGAIECRHIEVQASMRPASYISKVPKRFQKAGRAANSATRSETELVEGVAEWVQKKFRENKKIALMQSLCSGPWSTELVLNVVKCPHEVDLIRGHGIKIHDLKDIIMSLVKNRGVVKSAAGADFIELIQMGAHVDGECGRSKRGHRLRKRKEE